MQYWVPELYQLDQTDGKVLSPLLLSSALSSSPPFPSSCNNSGRQWGQSLFTKGRTMKLNRARAFTMLYLAPVLHLHFLFGEIFPFLSFASGTVGELCYLQPRASSRCIFKIQHTISTEDVSWRPFHVLWTVVDVLPTPTCPSPKLAISFWLPLSPFRHINTHFPRAVFVLLTQQ